MDLRHLHGLLVGLVLLGSELLEGPYVLGVLFSSRSPLTRLHCLPSKVIAT